MLFPKMLPFTNVVADGVASLELPIGMTYHRIILELGGTTFTKAMITNIKAKLNGKTFYEIPGTELDEINQYKGLTAAATFLTIDFTEPFAKTVGGMGGGAIGTASGVRSFTLEVTIAGATAPTLQSWAMQSEPMPLGLIMGLVHHPVTFSAGGTFPIVLPHGKEAGHLIKRVHFFHANMTALEVKKNGLVIFDEMALDIAEFIGEEYGQTWQAGLYVYDPILTRDVKRVVNTSNAQDLRFNVTVSAADTINVYAEYIGRLENF